MGIARNLRRLTRKKEAAVDKIIRRKAVMEPMEPRVLLSADFQPDAADALADGLDQFGDRLEDFLLLEGGGEGLLNTQLPFIVHVQETGDGLEQVAPTLGSLFSVQVDTNGDGAGGINITLDGLDKQGDSNRQGYGDGIVDAGEFVQGWLFGQIEKQLEGYSDTTANFATWLAGLNETLTVAQVGSPSVTITLGVISASDLTEAVPNADLMFDVDFKLTVSQNLAIDLGTEADALKLLYYTGDYEYKVSPVIPVDAALEFGFTFGVHTGGQESPGETLDGGDFFVRTADDLNISAKTNDPDDDTTDIEGYAFHLNIGFLGAEVTDGTIDFQAAVSTLLIDPDSPEILGFTTDQYGVEQVGGVVTGTNTITTEDLAHDAGFVLRIGNAGIATEVRVLADDNADMAGLLVDVNTALKTAGLDELIEASLDNNNHLVFTLIETTDTPLGFANESFSNSGVLSADPGAVDFASDRTFLLSVDGALPELVTVVFPDTARTELGFGYSQTASLPSLVAQNTPTTDELSGDATFSIAVRKADGSVVSGTVVVTLADTAGNTDYYYLADDINAQILADAPALAGLVAAIYDGTHFRFVPDGSIRAVDIYATGTAQSEIGFGSHQMTTLALTASNTPIATFDLSSDAHFELTVSYDAGTEKLNRTVVVTIPADLNGDAAALAADINAAIDTALAIDKVDVMVDPTGKFVLEAKDASVYALSISTNNTLIDSLVADVQSALNKAGLGSLVTASAVDADTLQLAAASHTLEITKTLTLDAGVTYTELQEPPAAGGTATGDLLKPEIDEDHSNIQFNLPVSIIAGLNYTPPDVAIVCNFSPFGQLLVEPQLEPPKPVATIGDGDTRFELAFTYTPTIDNQDSPVGPAPHSSTLTEEVRLVNMAEPLNFNLITAESMVGLLMGMGTALQQIANSGLFAGYDIPFADASLADLLNFTDADKYVFSGLIDTLLIYDTGGNGIYDPSVVGSLNDDADKLLKWIVDNKGTGDTGDDDVYLIPNFVTSQDLATKLDEILANMDLAAINANYNPASNKLTYDLELIGGERTTVSFDAPFEYDVSLSPFAKMTLYPSEEPSDLVNSLTGYTGLNTTFGIDLSPPGGIIYDVTDLAELNGGAGIAIKTERAVTGESGVRTLYSLSEDAHFLLKINNTVTTRWVTVSVDADETTDNTSIGMLIGDIEKAIDAAIQKLYDDFGINDLFGTVAVGYDTDYPTRLKLYGQSGAKIEFEANKSNTAVSELGFPVFSAEASTVSALRDPRILVGRLSSDATFEIDIAGDVAGPYSVAITASATEENRSIADLVADVNNSLAIAGIGDRIAATFDATSGQGPRLVLTAIDPDLEFDFLVSDTGFANLTVIGELGLPHVTTSANQYDFVIYDSAGHKYEIALDKFVDLTDPTPVLTGDVAALIKHINDAIGAINAANSIAGPTVSADFNSTHTGLQLFDESGGSGQFRVRTVNGSGALLTLGLMIKGVDDLIAGGPIGETHLDDRFFVRDAELWGALVSQTPNPPGEVEFEAPGAVGSALFGIVGVDTSLSGTLYAGFTAAIKDPATGEAGGTATLLELFEGAKQGRLTDDATFTVAYGSSPSDTVTVTVPKAATVANNTLADLVADVNTALASTSFDGIIKARVSGTRIEFIALDNSLTVANEAKDTQFIITAGNASARSGLGLDPLGTSTLVDKVMTVTANAASRYAVAEPVVEEVFTLPISGLIGEFTPGKLLYGWDTTPDLQTDDTALVLGVEYDSIAGAGVVYLSPIRGTFSVAEIVFQEFMINGANKSGALTQKSDFGDFNLHVEVQPGFDDIGFVDGDGTTSGFGLLDGKEYDVDFTIEDFGNPYDPAPPVAEFDDRDGDTGDLYFFINLDYADIGAALHDLLDLLVDVNENFGLLNLELPAIGKSISELLGLVDDFERGVTNIDEIFAAALLALDPEAVDLPALTLQDIPNALRGAFGLPEGVDPTENGAFNWITLDFDPGDGMLLVDFNIHESIDTKLGLDIEVDENLPNITSSGVLQVNGALDMHLSFGIDLADPNNAYLFDDTTIAAELHVKGEGQTYETSDTTDEDKDGMGLVFRASLGPLAVFIQDGDAAIDAAFSLGMNNFGKKLISQVDVNRNDDVLTDFATPKILKDENGNDINYADVVLPMFYGGEGPDNYLGDFEAHGQLVNPTTLQKGTLTITKPDFSGIEADILSGEIEFDPFEYILLAIDTLNLYLENLSDMLASEVLGIQLPFVGDQMADILFIENFRNSIYSTLKNGIANDIDPIPDDVTGLLEESLAAYLVGTVDDSDFDVSSENISNWYRQWNFTLHDTETIFLTDFDLGIPNLGFDVDIPVQVVLDWTLDIGFGVSFAEGAYIEVSDGNELDLDLTITLPTVGKGMLGFLRADVTDPGSDTGAVLNFDVNVKNGETTNERLGFSDIGKINPDATVWGRSLAEADPDAPVADSDVVTLHLETKAEWGMPQLMADLIVDWAIPEGTKVNTLNGNAVTPDVEGIGVNYISLNDMEFNAGSVATSLLEPIFGEILGYIEPFMPVIDVLTAPIPVLSDLAGEPFTLLDLAAIFGSVDAEFIDTIADILDVISMIDAAMEQTILELGDLVLYDYIGGIVNFDPLDPDSHLAEIDLASLGAATGLTLDSEKFDNNEENDFLEFIRSDPSPVKGLTMPIFTDARQTIGMFLNQNAVMVDYKLPPLAVEFEYLQVFPVFGPMAVSIEISFGFTVDLHSVGFDTYGYQRYAKGGFYNPEVMFDGFYLNDLDAEGVDAPEVLFEFGLVGAAELNLGIARAGVGGGIKAQIFFDWHDPIADGRVHISELIANVETADDNPLAVFDVGGALTFQLFAFLEISIIGFEQEFPITPETELFSFEEEFSHDPILATDIGGGVLMLNMGPTALDRIYGDISDGSESLTVTGSGTNSVTVGGKTFDDISHIIGMGGQGNDTITLNLGAASKITYELDGGLGDDTITVTGGTGKGVIIGGVGNDMLTGGDGNDTIYGGEGNDLIYGGGGQDIIFGDQGQSVQTSAYIITPYITSRVTSADGNDEIYGDSGDDIIIGAGGDDELWGDAGNDILIGDGGRFEYIPAGSDGHVDVASLRPADFLLPEIIPTDGTLPKTPEEISAGINAIFDELMETFHSTDLFFGGNDEIHGGENSDMMFGGSGNDILEGDSGNDLILGGKGFDEVFGGTKDSPITLTFTVTDKDTIFGGDQADIISGNEDADVISGGSGNDYIHGNDGNDVMKGDSGADIIFGDDGDDQLFGLTEPDILFGGVGDDLVVGGTNNDIMFGDDGVVAKLDPDNTAIGLKVIYNDLLIDATTVNNLLAGVKAMEGEFSDADERTLDLILTYVTTEDGDDIMSGEAADDIMLGGGGNDLMGGDVDPRLPDANVNGPTDISEDVLIGDGGMITFDQRRFRSIATVIEPDNPAIDPDNDDAFNDVIYGDNGNDYLFGGWGHDFLFGGHGKLVDLTAQVGKEVKAFRGATDGAASDNDIMLGDNGEILFAGYSALHPENFGIKELIRTTDISNSTGGHDYAEGELGNDVIFGGVNGSVDVLFGNADDDVILGDNGELDFDFDDAAHNLDTLDLIRSYRDGLGGEDWISGKQGDDVLIGGTGGDIIYGDDADASSGAADGEDIMLGDNADIFLIGTVGRLTVQMAEMTTGTAVDLITTTDVIDVDHLTKAAAEVCGGPDIMSGNAGNDIMLGGVNNDDGSGDPETDRLYGDLAVPNTTTIANDGDDIMLGDNGRLDFTYDPADYPNDDQTIVPNTDRNTLDLIRSREDGLGGVDVLSGNKGLDVAIGGTTGDTIYGDDASASAADDDLADLLLGDNADIFLVAAPVAPGAGVDLKTVLDAAVKTIRTTDKGHPEYGGSDTISGNAKGDIIAGGVFGDTLYGDRSVPTPITEGEEGEDIILGDNGAFEWLSTGRLSEINSGGAFIDIAANNPELWDKFGTSTADTDLTTLDLVTTEQPTSGGRDLIYGDEGRDFVFGGTDSDEIYGDDGNLDEEPESANNDLLFGDHGRIYPQFSTLRAEGQDWRLAFNSRNFFAIDVGDTKLLISAGGEGDRMWGEEGDDTMLGQQGDDRMWGGSGDDDMTGGHNVTGGYDELTAPAIDAVLGLTTPPVNDLMDGGSGDDSMSGDNAIIWRRGDDDSPRFRELTGATIYSTTNSIISANASAEWQSDPADAIGRDIQLVDHSDAVQATPLGRYGNDVMAGGADSDTMFGELGNDLMQGDGSIASVAVVGPFISRTHTVTDAGSPDTGETLCFNIPELASDADDYMEGNGGSDLMYGGLGQDDMIGGSSSLFGLISEQMRPDTTDYIYGGAGIDTDRNTIGATTYNLASEDGTTHIITTTPDGHARDADYIMGDNANVYRLVNATTDAFLNFNYDDAYGLQIIPRAMQQLDYTLGGADYAGGSYANGAANADNGAADLIHGESGDDIIFGMTGSDVIFGEGQDDDIVGGYGHDWISGGTGQDGVLGDDGLIVTSRNSTLGEPLYGIAGLLDKDPRPKYADGNVLDEVITTPGSIQYAVINLTGELKKTIDLVPFSYDPAWVAMDDEFPDNQDGSPYADDIIFGGLGTDWLHGGSGDDAISGAEALGHAYMPVYNALGEPVNALDLGYTAVDLPADEIVPGESLAVLNPGDVLAFNNADTDGQHPNNRFRAGEFALYDEYDPRRSILLTPSGELYKGTGGIEGADYFQFLLNFEETEGVVRPEGIVPKATGQQTESYPEVNDDGKDSIFGDLGNDWLVGGTGRDNMYGGWGNDLLNADDDHDGHEDVNELNDFTDTHPYYEDRSYGGAGRDVLIGNTGGDRLIDWVGEYNSYLVPYAPFGQASVSRTLQPFLPDFLYALSAGDGADPTRNSDTGAELERNGEPDAEMGLVLQKDFAWQDQTGAPADPQAGNIPGGARDVLRSATFNDATTQGWTAASGTWLLKSGTYYVEPTALGTDAISVWNHGEPLPSYFELTATVTPVKPIAGYKANAFIVFDYYSDEDFKFAGINSSTNKIEIGQRTAAGWQVLTSMNMLVKAGTSYNLLVALNGTTATIRVNNGLTLSYGFAPRVVDGMIYNFNDSGMIGLGADNAKAAIDNVNLLVLPPSITLTRSEDFSTKPTLLTPETGAWTLSSEGYYVGTPATGESLVLAGGSLTVGANYLLQLETKITTEATGGIIFDQYATDDFKWAAYEKDTNQVMLGHYTGRDGWVVDNSVIIKGLDDGDVTLSLTLKGTTVSILVNGAAALSHVYNSVATDGGFGLLAKDGAASFDFFMVKTDDPQFEGTLLLTASAAPETPVNDGGLLSETDLVPILKEAIARWEKVSGVDGALLAALYDLDFRIVDFMDLTLGQTTPGTVYIDADAAGWGWFVDETPEDDVEFVTEGGEDESRMDLLTTVMHEIGHVLEYDDAADDADTLMGATLDAGERYVPDGDSLVVMDTSDLSDGMEEPGFVPTANVEDPWLINFLVKKARKDYNPFEPVETIRILVASDEENV